MANFRCGFQEALCQGERIEEQGTFPQAFFCCCPSFMWCTVHSKCSMLCREKKAGVKARRKF